MTQFAVRATFALLVSGVVFATLEDAGLRTGVAAAGAFAAGAVPNSLVRQWAWKIESNATWKRELVAFTSLAVLVWSLSTSAANHAPYWAHRPGALNTDSRILLATAAYAIVQVLFFPVKFAIFDRWVFRQHLPKAS